MKFLVAFGLCTITLLYAVPANAEVYRCADGVYQADPCDEQSKPLVLEKGSTVDMVVPTPRDPITPVPEKTPQVVAVDEHPCKRVKVDKDAIRFRRLTTCMTESQMLKAAGPQQYTVYEYFDEGRHYREYRFTEPRAGFGSYALVEGGYVIDAVNRKSYINNQ
ncbi:hypothetical protein ACNPKB_10070 [Shewanella marisflavi]|uniref:hypothetical protein n=2 Tax=Shewanella TaxID=22 RepID=UPI003AB08DEF